MAYKDIVVHLGKDNRSAARLNAAIQLAQRHEGRVTGVYVLSRRNIPGSIRCEFPPQILKRLDTGERRLAEEAEERFTERTARTAVRNKWRLMAGDLADAIVTSAHYADIVIVGQTDPKDDDSLGGLADSAVLGAGGPVLIWPYAGEFDVNAATIMLAWNGTREAKHALDGALPLMQQARKVIVFGVDMDDGRHIPGADIGAYRAPTSARTWPGMASARRPGTRRPRQASPSAMPCSPRSAIAASASSSWVATVITQCARSCWVA